MSSELYIGRVTTRLLRVRLARALHAADCGCEDFGDPTTDEDDRYIKSADEALASLAAAGALPANSDEVSEPSVKFTWNLLSHAICIEECWELLDEVRALDEENRVLRYNLATERSMRHFIADNPPPVLPPAPVNVLPLLAYIDQLDRNGGLTSAVSEKLRNLIRGINS